MVAKLTEQQGVSERVAAAMRAVPRHLFVPGVPPDEAYRDEPIVTRRDDAGRPTSSSSQPAIMAAMLDQLDVRPGHRVLEIGAGTGYNAALLARLAAPGGLVVCLDIDADVADEARAHLDEAGLPQVEVVCRDGAEGHPERAPYDRLIATVGAWDLAPAWMEQLAPGGRMVVPLDVNGLQLSVALDRDGDHWTSRSVLPCGFMRMRGSLAGTEVTEVVSRDPQVALSLPGPRELGDLAAALGSAPVELPLGDLLDGRKAPQDGAWDAGHHTGVPMWLALHEPRWCTVLGEEHGFCAGIAEPSAVALLPLWGDAVVRGHGPGGERLARELLAHVRAWTDAGRPQPTGLRIDVHPAGADVPGPLVVRKRHTTVSVALPSRG